jgi:hypothetical protein
MPVSVPADHADAGGPNASIEYGDVGKMSALQRETGQLATGPAGPPPLGQPSSPVGGPGQPGPSPQQQPQPPQGEQMTPQRVRDEVFSPPAQSRQEWRKALRVMAAHPDAHYLRALADAAEGK